MRTLKKRFAKETKLLNVSNKDQTHQSYTGLITNHEQTS